ncbi:MAG: hypothetical protein IT435_05475 [Phycisphaerales bacterium]|nr:hypothetical protein [Phycisphaerales bacterium]
MTIEPILTSNDQGRGDLLEQVAMDLYDAAQDLRRLVIKPGTVRSADLGHIGVRMHDCLVMLERAGVPTPRLPTPQEMDR